MTMNFNVTTLKFSYWCGFLDENGWHGKLGADF